MTSRPADGREAGFTLIELVIVVSMIAVLMAASVSYYQKIQDDANAIGLQMLASRFLSSAVIVNLKWEAAGRPQILALEGVELQMNERGWPIGASAPYIGKELDACQQLWEGLFRNPGELVNHFPEGDFNTRFWTSRPQKGVCRYQLASKQRNQYYFDYYSSDGRVETVLN